MKDANECTYSNKDHFFASLIAICRSATVFEFKEDAKNEFGNRILKGNKFMTGGIMGERHSKSTGELEKKGNKRCPWYTLFQTSYFQSSQTK